MKRCNACGEEKDRRRFSPDKRNKDGLQGACKPCCVERVKRSAARHPEAKRERTRRWRAANREKVRQMDRKWREENYEKHLALCREYNSKRRLKHGQDAKRRAHRAVQNAVGRGDLVKPDSCERCGELGYNGSIHAHHEDYHKPLEVHWLCPPCHAIAHGRTLVAA